MDFLREKDAPNPVLIVFQDAALKALLCPNSKQKVFAISVETAATFLENLFLQRAGGRGKCQLQGLACFVKNLFFSLSFVLFLAFSFFSFFYILQGAKKGKM